MRIRMKARKEWSGGQAVENCTIRCESALGYRKSLDAFPVPANSHRTQLVLG